MRELLSDSPASQSFSAALKDAQVRLVVTPKSYVVEMLRPAKGK